jgi:hypothetical protein
MRRDYMSVGKIQIAPWLYQKIRLGKTTYTSEQEAIDALTKALEQNEIELSIVKKGNKTSFLNESGGELATIVPA